MEKDGKQRVVRLTRGDAGARLVILAKERGKQATKMKRQKNALPNSTRRDEEKRRKSWLGELANTEKPRKMVKSRMTNTMGNPVLLSEEKTKSGKDSAANTEEVILVHSESATHLRSGSKNWDWQKPRQ